ncbi:hypothetical protein ACFW5D_30835 [Streptomyces sp. NPDC058770]|uniref:hypothetical protein n=1 Tax=unclassified Streptomyces TaxID=2593676 RepID=UPI0036CB8166
MCARLVRDLMRLCLLMDRRCPPHAKWPGSAFARTPRAPALAPVLTAALAATDRNPRETPRPAPTRPSRPPTTGSGSPDRSITPTRPYHSRPFRVLHAERFAAALADRSGCCTPNASPPRCSTASPIRWCAGCHRIGTVDQFVDSTDVLGHPTSAQEAARATTALRRAADRPGGGPSAPTPPV